MFSTDSFPKPEHNYIDQVLEDIKMNAHKTAVVSFYDVGLNKFSALTIAASSIAYSRMKSSINPVWPKELEQLSCLKWKNIEKCLQKLQTIVKNIEKSPSTISTSTVFFFEKKEQKLDLKIQDQENLLGKRAPLDDHRWRKVLGELNFLSNQQTIHKSFYPITVGAANYRKL